MSSFRTASVGVESNTLLTFPEARGEVESAQSSEGGAHNFPSYDGRFLERGHDLDRQIVYHVANLDLGTYPNDACKRATQQGFKQESGKTAPNTMVWQTSTRSDTACLATRRLGPL